MTDAKQEQQQQQQFGDFCTLSRQGNVFILTMKLKDNRFNPTTIQNIHQALDVVEASEGPAALLTVSSNDKIFSNGLDLDFMMSSSPAEITDMLKSFVRLLGRFFKIGVPTIAVLNGHAFAGGFMFALAHDFRLMRGDRGFCCLNEIDINFSLSPGMMACITAKISPPAVRDAILLARRFTAPEGAKYGFIDQALPLDQLMPKALELANKVASKGTNRFIYGALRQELYHREIDTMMNDGVGNAAEVFARL